MKARQGRAMVPAGGKGRWYLYLHLRCACRWSRDAISPVHPTRRHGRGQATRKKGCWCAKPAPDGMRASGDSGARKYGCLVLGRRRRAARRVSVARAVRSVVARVGPDHVGDWLRGHITNASTARQGAASRQVPLCKSCAGDWKRPTHIAF